jgi:hypothetical protein
MRGLTRDLVDLGHNVVPPLTGALSSKYRTAAMIISLASSSPAKFQSSSSDMAQVPAFRHRQAIVEAELLQVVSLS